jgi:DNA-binding response OmpR family regulator
MPLKKIAIIDDEEAMVQLLSVELESEGYHVLTAGNGVSGLKLIQDKQPDLVLLDIMMPGLNGYEVIKSVKEDPSVCDIPIIMLTARSHDEDIQRGLDLGADDYVTKPFHAGLLVKRISTLLKIVEDDTDEP